MKISKDVETSPIILEKDFLMDNQIHIQKILHFVYKDCLQVFYDRRTLKVHDMS